MQHLFFGYNTNGFAHHHLFDVIKILGELNYKGIAITLDHGHCNPYMVTDRELFEIKQLLEKYNLRCVIETGARYLLNYKAKHEPTFFHPENHQTRIDFTLKAIDIAKYLNAESVTIFSGSNRIGLSETKCWQRLVDSLNQILNYASLQKIQIGFEPEPGMFIDTLEKFDLLCSKLVHPQLLHLTLDIGHAFCLESMDPAEIIRRYRNRISSIHIEDIKDKKHEHLFFGKGDIDFKSILKILQSINFTQLINVELSRDSHQAVDYAKSSIEFLTSLVNEVQYA